MCSFTVLGGPMGFENQSVSGVTTICLTQCNTSPSHRVDQVVDCGLRNVGPHLFNGCVKLLDVGRKWNTLSYMPIQSIPNMLNGWLVSMLAMQELGFFSASRNCVQILATCSNTRWWLWINGTTMGLRILLRVSLCIQNAINKMYLCSLSITYGCPYHNPTTNKPTMLP